MIATTDPGVVDPREVHLVALYPGDDPARAQLRRAVLRLRPAPGQRQFSGAAEQTLPQADADPDRIPFAVVWTGQNAPPGGAAVGFGVLDGGSARMELSDDPAQVVLLRAFYIEPHWQGYGVGRAACLALDTLVSEALPWARHVLLTVNERNEPAIRAYRAGGFRDTGRRHLGGPHGYQLVLARTVGSEAPA
ncbi:GNAT family N-acetyltransferase [Lipingzhangella sp. LS1_29]|uniref:GNAT family N-acetyltransferase n=1 Tax=Lipingzhangella rawalii TaxID=2055835 RepID=A0ABU2H6R8_9ACTN|nr:GNAT family N-acetyltransferase [Lipingzhangella rawalii]MDS1270997.1 GNAT family N-acetyltransferase [Lipingzhangella rawalii]